MTVLVNRIIGWLGVAAAFAAALPLGCIGGFYIVALAVGA